MSSDEDTPKESVDSLRERATSGDVPAMVDLAKALAKRAIGEKDETKHQSTWDEAIKWYNTASEKGNDQAMYLLGRAYTSGVGVQKDIGQATQWMRRAAEAGNPTAMFAYALRLRKGQGCEEDNEESKKWFRKSAEAGNPSGQFELSVWYAVGKQNTELDAVQSVRWATLAADQGHAKAAGNLANRWREGLEGVPCKDLEKAVQYYSIAADAGNLLSAKHAFTVLWKEIKDLDRAQEAIIRCSSIDEEKAKDPTEPWFQAISWILKERRDKDSAIKLFHDYIEPYCAPRTGSDSDDSGDSESEDEEVAAFMYDKMGTLIQVLGATGGASDPDADKSWNPLTEAYPFFLKAAELGSQDCMYRIACMYGDGTAPPCQGRRNLPEAVKWFKRAAENGHVISARTAGMILLTGGDGRPNSQSSIEKDPQKAVQLLTQAAQDDDAQAARMLSSLYSQGIGVEQSDEKAALYLKMACNLEEGDPMRGLGPVDSDSESDSYSDS